MPTWRDRLDRAKELAREKAPEARERAEQLAREARTRAEAESKRGRAALDRQLDARRTAAERRAHWYEHIDGPVHTQGFHDEDEMRLSIEAAAAHGWRATDIVEVRKTRGLGGLTGLVAREAVDRVRQSPRWMVTFHRDPPAPSPDA